MLILTENLKCNYHDYDSETKPRKTFNDNLFACLHKFTAFVQCCIDCN